jgi:cysteine-S-conjugate beta-lyase
MSKSSSPIDPSTQLIHHPYQPPAGFSAPQPGVFKASTVIFPNVAALRARDWQRKTGYTYGLHGTPTSFLLEERLCSLEGGLQCLLVPSGLAAVAHVSLSLLKSGDEVLIPDNAYGPNLTLTQNELSAYGISYQCYDPANPADLASRIGSKTKLVWLEVPGSVSMEFADLPALVRVCRERGGADLKTALDNTWGAGLAFAPFDLLPNSNTQPLGVDISIQALTKYPSGGGDVLMGSVITRDEALHLQLKATHMRLGFGVGMNDVETVLRSLPSMALRYDAHDRSARSLATWCNAQPEISSVLHPALPGAPGHANWQTLCGPRNRAAGLFSIMLHERYSREQIDRFCDSLQWFKLGYSWGGPISLAVPYDMRVLRKTASKAWGREPWQHGSLVRFSIGLEAVADLQADLVQALMQLRK